MTRLASVPRQPTWEDDLQQDRFQRPLPTVSNLTSILVHDERWAGVLAWNELAGRPEALQAPPWHADDAAASAAGPLVDADVVRLQAWLERAYRMRPAKSVVEDAMRGACLRRSFHPVRDYLAALEWDGQPRVDRWLTSYAGVEATPYSSSVGRWWLISAVARVREPGCMAKYVLNLEGPQDMSKSTLCRKLAAPWFSDSPVRMGDKDGLITLRDSWVRELAEVDSYTSHASQAQLKAYLSSPTDKYRPPFGKMDILVPRTCVFIATINPSGSGYLHDPTGNVRWHPVRCTHIDLEAVERDRDQLWAEAVALYEQGAKWWPQDQTERDLCAEQQEERYQVDAREEAIGLWLLTAAGRAAELSGDLTTLRLLEGALGIKTDKIDRASQIAVGQAMHRLGYRRARHSSGGREWHYTKEVSSIERMKQAAAERVKS